MAQLIEVISLPQMSAFTTAQQCFDWLNTVSESQPDHTLYTVRQIEIALGGDLTKLGIVLGTLQTVATENPVVAAFSQTLNTTGLDFSNSNVQGMIVQIGAEWPSDIKDAIQSIGTIHGVPNWQLYGLPSQPTLADIQSILLQRMLGNVIGPIQQAIHNGTLTTVAEVFAAIAAQESAQQANIGN